MAARTGGQGTRVGKRTQATAVGKESAWRDEVDGRTVVPAALPRGIFRNGLAKRDAAITPSMDRCDRRAGPDRGDRNGRLVGFPHGRSACPARHGHLLSPLVSRAWPPVA